MEEAAKLTPLKTRAGTKREFGYELVLTQDQGLMARESSTSKLKALPHEQTSPPRKRHCRDKEKGYSSQEEMRGASSSKPAKAEVPEHGRYAKQVWTMLKELKSEGPENKVSNTELNTQ